ATSKNRRGPVHGGFDSRRRLAQTMDVSSWTGALLLCRNRVVDRVNVCCAAVKIPSVRARRHSLQDVPKPFVRHFIADGKYSDTVRVFAARKALKHLVHTL